MKDRGASSGEPGFADDASPGQARERKHQSLDVAKSDLEMAASMRPARRAEWRVAGGKTAESGRGPRKRMSLNDPRAPEGARGRPACIRAPFQGAGIAYWSHPGGRARLTVGLAPGFPLAGPPGRE